MVILSLDASLSSTGYAIFKGIKLIKYGKIQSKKDKFKDEDMRLNYMCNIIENIIKEYKVEKIICEDQFTSINSKTILSLRKLIGGIMRTANYNDIDVKYYYPSTWRKILGINKGKSNDKKLAAYNYLLAQGINIGEFKATGVHKNDDIVDSICIGLCFLKDKVQDEENRKP